MGNIYFTIAVDMLSKSQHFAIFDVFLAIFIPIWSISTFHNCRNFPIFRGPRPCAMTICGQLARAKAATDL